MGDRSPDGFADFIEKETGLKAKRPPRILADLTPQSFTKFQQDYNCSFIFYYSGLCSHCRKILPEIHAASPAFQFDNNSKMAILNCGLYDEFCINQDAGQYPIALLYRGGETLKYEGENKADSIVAFINDKCGAQRAMDGNLNDEAGRILSDTVRRIVAEFKKGGDRQKLIEEMKGVNGAEAYVKTMERIIANGDATVESDIAKMTEVIKQRKGSAVSIDGVKRRLNVFREFLTDQPEL
jgi:protein disulfide-isomerase A6